MTERSVKHATFVIERTYDASPARVFDAFADPAAKRRWFVEGEGWEIESFEFDFRPGGSEYSTFRYQGGPLIRNDTVYQDIVENRRIVTAYTMMVGENRISASLATIELVEEGVATRLTYTEQGAFLDGYDDAKGREEGCRGLLEALAIELQRKQAAA